MANKIHISTARMMINSGNPVKLELWVKSGELQTWHNCVGLRFNKESGTRTIKLLNSQEIRSIRDVLIYKVNDLEVIL